MTKKLIPKTRLKSTDGFVMCKLNYAVEPESFPKLLKALRLESGIYPKNAYYMDKVIQSIFVKYMRKFCKDSFAVAVHTEYPTKEDDYRQNKSIYLAFRSEKELFKFIMKIGAKRTRWWRSGLSFTFVGREDDPFEKRHAGENWNYEDPQDMIP